MSSDQDGRLMIDPDLSLAHTAEVVTLQPHTEQLFRVVFPEYDGPVTADDIRRKGIGMQHVLGLIDLSLRSLETGRKFGWRCPGELLDLPAQNGLVDVLAALVAIDKDNLLDL